MRPVTNIKKPLYIYYLMIFFLIYICFLLNGVSQRNPKLTLQLFGIMGVTPNRNASYQQRRTHSLFVKNHAVIDLCRKSKRVREKGQGSEIRFVRSSAYEAPRIRYKAMICSFRISKVKPFTS